MKFISGYKTEGLWWFRIFGWGLYWKDGRKRGMLYSDRRGIGCLKIGNWIFKFLKKDVLLQ